MADDFIHVEVDGIDKIQSGLDRFPVEIPRYMKAAGKEASEEILETEGLRKYPPAGPANQPPAPYYIRGRGMQYQSGNDFRSERLGTQFYVEAPTMQTIIGNRASYAPYVIGAAQARWMANIGWRKLLDVAKEKIGNITEIYNGWVKKCIDDLGL